MSETRRPLERTPRGVAKWISINTPDTKFKDEGEYRLTLLLGGKDADAMKARINEAIALAVAEAKANKNNAKHLKAKTIKAADAPYKADTDKEGNETGLTAFTFKAKASGKRKDGSLWEFKPRAFDLNGEPIDLTTTQVWGGSLVKVAYELGLYGIENYSPKVGAGVSLKLSAVQILKLKTGSGKDAKAFGFEAEDVDDEDQEAPEEKNADSETPTENEEF